MEEFTTKKVIDVACGNRFTVVISTASSNELAYQNLKQFKTTLLKNAAHNVTKIKEYCDAKLKKKIENDPILFCNKYYIKTNLIK